MGLTDSYAYFLPVHALYQIVSINLCHNGREECESDTRICSKPVEDGQGNLSSINALARLLQLDCITRIHAMIAKNNTVIISA